MKPTLRPLNRRQAKIYDNIHRYLATFPDHRATRWEVLNYLLGYDGLITADHITAIDAVHYDEGKIDP